MSYYSRIDRWEIPMAAWAGSLDELAEDGRRGVEGIVLWLGTRGDGRARATHIAVLRGPGVRRKRYLLEIDASVMSEMTDLACEKDIVLLGQVHSHAPDCRTDLSDADRNYGFAVPHYLSVVAPAFARQECLTLQECGVHIFGPAAGYQRLTLEDVDRKIFVHPNVAVQRLIVGGSQ